MYINDNSIVGIYKNVLLLRKYLGVMSKLLIQKIQKKKNGYKKEGQRKGRDRELRGRESKKGERERE
jgi:hypothetical protein